MKTHMYTSLTLPCSIIAIGAFDGVHQGHQAVIQQAVEKSKELHVPSVIYTFDPPPRVFFQGVQMITTIAEKLSILEKLGVDHVVVTRFDLAYANKSAHDFIQTLANLNPMEIIVGEDFRFGQGRNGDLAMLKKYFNVDMMQPVCCSKGNTVSSTRIRQLIAEGDTRLSNLLLGWPIGE